MLEQDRAPSAHRLLFIPPPAAVRDPVQFQNVMIGCDDVMDFYRIASVLDDLWLFCNHYYKT